MLNQTKHESQTQSGLDHISSSHPSLCLFGLLYILDIWQVYNSRRMLIRGERNQNDVLVNENGSRFRTLQVPLLKIPFVLIQELRNVSEAQEFLELLEIPEAQRGL